MANPLEAWKQHAMASEQMDLMGVGSHQKKGWNFAQNFPSLVPGGPTATQWVGPGLAKAYQYAQELGRSMFDTDRKNYTLADAWKEAGKQSDANIQGMLGEGFDKDEYDEWMHAQGYAPDYDFSGIRGQTAFALPGAIKTIAGATSMDMGLPMFLKRLFGTRAKLAGTNIAIEAGKGLKKKIKPTIKKKGTMPTGTGGSPNIISKPKPKYKPPQQTGGGGGVHSGMKTTSSRRHKAPGGGGYGPHKKSRNTRGKADGGLINFYKYGGFLG
jgi:hypothetical protein